MFDMDHWAYELVVPRGVLQGIPLARYDWWDRTLPIFTRGTFADGTPTPRYGTLGVRSDLIGRRVKHLHHMA